nr:DNA internalization-related competence protein ComEC/Rec2 [Paenibacillus caui]
MKAACCWIAGSGLALLSGGGRSFWLLWTGLVLMAPLLALAAGCALKRFVWLLIILTAASFYWQINDSRNVTRLPEALHAAEKDLEGASVQIEGTIVSAVERDGDRVDFTAVVKRISRANQGAEWAKAGGEKVKVQVRLAEKQEIESIQSWERGRRIRMSGSLEKPAGARNFGGFDYASYLHNKRIHWIVKGAGAAAVHIDSGSFGPASLLGYNDRLRAAIGNRVADIFGERSAGYMKGLLIGDTDELHPDIYKGFSALGLTHILAISGSHVAVNVAVLFWLLRLAKVPRETAFSVVLVFIPFYMLVTGLSPSVVRSGIMAMIGLYLMRRQLLKDGLNIIAAAALLMLLWEPYYLLDVSFQLSFSVTEGLIVLVPVVRQWFGFLPKRLADAAAITLTAQLVSFPLTIYYFNQFSLLSFAANLVLVPFVSLLSLPLGTAALLLGSVWLPLGTWAAYPVQLVNYLTFEAVAWLEGRTGFGMIWKSPPLWWIGLYYLTLFLLLKISSRLLAPVGLSVSKDETVPLYPEMRPSPSVRSGVGVSIMQASSRRAGWLSLALAVILAGTLYSGYQPAYAGGKGYVQFLDVGQGDSILIITPKGRNILVDGGGTVSFRKAADAWRGRREPYEVGAKVVVPLLKKRGIHSLDAVIVTHWDQDHAGGLQAVLKEIPVESLIVNGSISESTTYADLADLALRYKIPIYFASYGMRLKADSSTELMFLGPLANENEASRPGQMTEIPLVTEQNAHSVVFLLNMEGATFLFTGDLDAGAEHLLLARLKQENGAKALGMDRADAEAGAASRLARPSGIDVLKVGHHGSKSSTTKEWLDYWHPVNAVISVGANNTYGHPNADVMKRLESSGTAIYRTDLMGEVQMKVYQGEISFRHRLRE